MAAAIVHHLDKPLSGVLVLRKLLEMLGQDLNPFGEDGDLYLGRTSILLVLFEALYDFLFFLFM